MHDQINGKDRDQPVLLKKNPIRYSFPERRRIAEEFIRSRSSISDISRKISIIKDLIRLCRRQECGVLKASRKRMRRLSDSEAAGRDSPPSLPHSVRTDLSESETDNYAQFPVKCNPFQCLICLGDRGKPLLDRLHSYGSKFSMQRHVSNSHRLRPDACPHPDPSCTKIAIKSTMHYKNHAAAVHGIELGEKVWLSVP